MSGRPKDSSAPCICMARMLLGELESALDFEVSRLCGRNSRMRSSNIGEMRKNDGAFLSNRSRPFDSSMYIGPLSSASVRLNNSPMIRAVSNNVVLEIRQYFQHNIHFLDNIKLQTFLYDIYFVLI